MANKKLLGIALILMAIGVSFVYAEDKDANGSVSVSTTVKKADNYIPGRVHTETTTTTIRDGKATTSYSTTQGYDVGVKGFGMSHTTTTTTTPRNDGSNTSSVERKETTKIDAPWGSSDVTKED
jgi:hypothetical protein